MKKRNRVIVCCLLVFGMSSILPVHAQDYSDSGYWVQKCSQPQSSQADVQACQGFQTYQQQRYEELQANIEQYSNDIASLQADTEKSRRFPHTAQIHEIHRSASVHPDHR